MKCFCKATWWSVDEGPHSCQQKVPKQPMSAANLITFDGQIACSDYFHFFENVTGQLLGFMDLLYTCIFLLDPHLPSENNMLRVYAQSFTKNNVFFFFLPKKIFDLCNKLQTLTNINMLETAMHKVSIGCKSACHAPFGAQEKMVSVLDY